MLTGKCKEDFEKWFITSQLKGTKIDNFYMQYFSMQYGVYVDFFDSVGIELYGGRWEVETHKGFSVLIFEEGHYDLVREETRHEARKKAIEKANEIYNNQ